MPTLKKLFGIRLYTLKTSIEKNKRKVLNVVRHYKFG